MEKWQERQLSSFLWPLRLAISWQEMHSPLDFTPRCSGLSGRLGAIGPTRRWPQLVAARASARRTGNSLFIEPSPASEEAVLKILTCFVLKLLFII